MNHDDSAPPPSPIPPAETIEGQVGRYRREQKSLAERVNGLAAEVADLRRLVGTEGSAIRNEPPTGLHRGLVDMGKRLDAGLGEVSAGLATLTAAIRAAEAARVAEEAKAHAAAEAADKAAARRAASPISRVTWIVIGVSATAIVGGAWAAVFAYAARHWQP